MEKGEQRSPKNAPGQDGASKEQRACTCGDPHAHADDTNGGRGAEGGSGQHGNSAAEQKGNQQNDLWAQQLCRMADDIGNRAAGTPQCCHHADQDKYDQNVFSSEDTGAEH